MSRVEILQEMQLVIQEQLDREDIVLTEATILIDLGVESIEFMEFIINLEDEFSLEISDYTIDHMDKVSDLLDYMSEQQNNKLENQTLVVRFQRNIIMKQLYVVACFHFIGVR